MNQHQTLTVINLSAKIISSLMACFILYMFMGDVVYSMQHTGATYVQPLSTAAGRHDALMLGMMALIVAGMVLVWWRERAGAWMSIISITAIIGCVWHFNGIPMHRLAAFLLATVPAIMLLAAPRQRRPHETSL